MMDQRPEVGQDISEQPTSSSRTFANLPPNAASDTQSQAEDSGDGEEEQSQSVASRSSGGGLGAGPSGTDSPQPKAKKAKGPVDKLAQIASELGKKFLSVSGLGGTKLGKRLSKYLSKKGKKRGGAGGEGNEDVRDILTAQLRAGAQQRSFASATGGFLNRKTSIFQGVCMHYDRYAYGNRIPSDKPHCPTLK